MKTLVLDWICTADEDTLHAARTRAKGEAISDLLWRRLEIKASSKALLLEMSQVNEDDLQSPGPALNQSRFGFSWEDLEDSNFLCKMIAHEQFCVGSRVLRVLDTLKKQQSTILRKIRTLEEKST